MGRWDFEGWCVLVPMVGMPLLKGNVDSQACPGSKLLIAFTSSSLRRRTYMREALS